MSAPSREIAPAFKKKKKKKRKSSNKNITNHLNKTV